MATPSKERSIFILPSSHPDKKFMESTAIRLRNLRLTSLRADPDAFSSTYADESKQPPGFWLDRACRPETRHIIIAQPKSQVSGVENESSEEPLGWDWIGILVLLGPKIVNSSSLDRDFSLTKLITDSRGPGPTESVGIQSTLEYDLAGFWIAPDFRREGLGIKLIDRALEQIKLDARDKNVQKGVCMVSVDDRNSAAQGLYNKMGFEVVGENQRDSFDGHHLKSIVMRREIVFNHGK